MKKHFIILSILISAVILISCSNNNLTPAERFQEQMKEKYPDAAKMSFDEKVDAVEKGMTVWEVEAILGTDHSIIADDDSMTLRVFNVDDEKVYVTFDPTTGDVRKVSTGSD